MSASGAPILLSRAGVGLHAGVGRAAVSNWESRHDDFPRPIRSEGREMFDAMAVAAWLDGRVIPSNALRDGESTGSDYGTRFRRGLGLSRPADAKRPRGSETAQRAPLTPSPGGVPDGGTSGAKAARWLLNHFRGQDLPATVIWLAFLVYLRERQSSTWSQLQERVTFPSDWQVLEDAWRRVMPEATALQRTHAPVLAAPGMTDERSWSVDRVVHLVDKAYSAAANAPRHAGDRSPSADIFVHLLEAYAQTVGRRSTEYFTPRAVVHLAVDALADLFQASPSIYDPFCRTGEFLDEAVTRLRRRRDRPAQLLGHSPNPALRPLAQMNLLLHGVDASIDDGHWWEHPPHQRFDLVFANPPFNMRLPEELIRSQPWHYGTPPVHNGNYAWLQHVVSQLNAGGRAAVVMPNNAGFTASTREQDIRAAMVEDGVVECVIGLPPNLFTGTAIPVSLWLLRAPTGQPRDVLFIDATDLGVSLSRVLHTLSSKTSDRIVQTLNRWRQGEGVDETGFAQAVPVARLRAGDYKLSPTVHVEPRRPLRDLPGEQQQIADLLRRSSLLSTGLRSVSGDVRRLTALMDSTRASSHARTVPLGQLCALKAGPGGSRLHGDLQQVAGVPVVLPKHLRDGMISDHPGVSVSDSAARTLAAYRLEIDDVLLSRTAERGRVARVLADQRGWLLSTGLIRLRVVDDQVLPGYLAHQLNSAGCHEWMVRNMAGTVVSAITLTTLAQLPISVPSRKEQEMLSDALDAVAAQARTYAELAAVTQSLREALTGSLFTVPGE